MRGHFRERRTWEFIVDIDRHPLTGRRRQKSKSGFATKRETESALHDFIRYVEGGGTQSGANQPCRLLEPRARVPTDSRHSLPHPGGIRGLHRREIVPIIGGLDVAEIKPGHIRAVLIRTQERGLSAATIAQVRSVLGSALRQAVADGLITANPVTARSANEGASDVGSAGTRTPAHR